MDWTEIIIRVPADDVDRAGDIANMTVPYGIYIEDYRTLEEEAMEIAHIDLIDEALLQKDRSVGLVHIYISPEENPQEAVQFLRERFSAEKIEHEIEQAACRNEDWENNWRAFFHPMPVGERLLIRPVWEEVSDAGGRVILDLEPGLAFGTGTHETTRLCMEALEPYVNENAEVLDVGCGSGILSVAALLLGAKNATGVDIDKIAVRTARENGERNGFCEPQYKVLHGSLTDEVTGRYDLVLANIVADAIILLSKNVRQFMRPGAVYIVSGIIDLRESEVAAALKESGFQILKRFEESGWLCFVCA
ncbi:MAG: 50S ribosomal protein L11 methyltransferase [Oscillospiraceae bacterium]|jgi:ribosomal protein L11 methyltransferase|nr:50S ribosomal protein L11 methyltransferase [Oscillospiraceae bacterium]